MLAEQLKKSSAPLSEIKAMLTSIKNKRPRKEIKQNKRE
jgi:hypothetical protein